MILNTESSIQNESWANRTKSNRNLVPTYAGNLWWDGNLNSGDGWSAGGRIEVGWYWDWLSFFWAPWYEICGDGIRFNSITTYWDDGNTVSGDGWSATWAIEAGYVWIGGSSTTPDQWEVWGDGIRTITVSGFWDDGNNNGNDGCSSNWRVESGWSCSGGTPSFSDTCSEIWGDGKRFNSLVTYCDDGNIIDGDGCDSNWNIEIGWLWAGGTSASKDTWSEIWGDGIRFNTNATYCDDGNLANNDGWDSSWKIEVGWTWSGGNSFTKDTWLDIWGDGKKYTTDPTFCDDGNKISKDGCNSTWGVEVGWIWGGGTPTSKDIWIEIWGDGIRFNVNATYWDDGNTK